MKTSVLLPPVYQIEEGPFRGGMGSVYRVLHREWGTQLAVKQPLPEMLENKRALELFLSECRLWVMLGMHEHIVMCHYVRTLQGVPTVFAEWMPGGDLQTCIASGLLYKKEAADERAVTNERAESEKRAGTDEHAEPGERAGTDVLTAQKKILDIGFQIASGMAYAHSRGLIHRDLKPANILFAGDGTAKVTDFGLAVLRGSGADAFAGFGTAAYAAPEQHQKKEIGPAADIWSFGVILLEMFLGERRWKNSLFIPTGLGIWLSQSAVPLPGGVRELIMRCCDPQPARRPADFKEVISALRNCWRSLTGREYPRRDPGESALIADTWNNRALSYLDLGMESDAEECWRKAIKSDPGHMASIYNQSMYAWRTARTDDLQTMRILQNACNNEPIRENAELLARFFAERGSTEPILKLRGIYGRDLLPEYTDRNKNSQIPEAGKAAAVGKIIEKQRKGMPGRSRADLRDDVLKEHLQDRRCLIMSKPARFLSVSGSEAVFLFADRTAELWNFRENKRISVLETGDSRLLDALILPDGTVCACSGEGLTFFSRGGKRKELVPVREGTANRLFLCGEGKEILFYAWREDAEGGQNITRNYAIRIDSRTGKRRAKLRFDSKSPGFFLPLQDGRELLIPTEAGLLRVDPVRGKVRKTYRSEVISDSESGKTKPADTARQGRVYGGSEKAPAAGTKESALPGSAPGRGEKSSESGGGNTDFRCAAVSSDEKLLAACAGDTLWLWDLQDGRLLTHFHVGRCRSLAFVRRQTSASHESARSGRGLFESGISDPGLSGSGPSGSGLSGPGLSGSGPLGSGLTDENRGILRTLDYYLLSSAEEPEVRLWELPSGRCLRTFAPHRGGVRCLRTVGNEAFLSAGELDGIYYQQIPHFEYKALWKLCRAEETRRLRQDQDHFRELIYRAADLWKKGDKKLALENLYLARSIHGYERNQAYLRLNAAMGKSLRIHSLQNVWSRGADRENTRIDRHLREEAKDPCRCTDQKSGRTLLARFDGDVLIREKDGSSRTIRTGRRGVCAAGLSKDGKYTALGYFDGKLIVLDNRDGHICWEKSGGHMATRLCFDPAGGFLLSGREDGTILVHAPDDGRILKVLTGRKSSVTALVFSEDGQFLRSDTEDGGVRIWQFDYRYTCD